MRRVLIISLALLLVGCASKEEDMTKIVFLHHSTGNAIWVGKTNKYLYRLTRKGDINKFFEQYNKKNKTSYKIKELIFPKSSPYGWSNYPYDYYNIWVKHAGDKLYKEEPTLEILTREFNIIMFKHCFPVSNIQADSGIPDLDSDIKSLENYKAQYNALKAKMHEFPENKFIVWTPAVNVQKLMTEEEALRTREFYEWIIGEWDEMGDNIFIWDFYKYETSGGLYLDSQNAFSSENSHPNREFSGRVAPLLGKFITDVIESKVK